MDEVLRQLEAPIQCAEQRVGPDAHVGQGHLGVIRRHVEGPPEELDLEAGRVGGNKECADPFGVAGVAAGASEDDVVRRMVQAAVPPLHPVEHPLIAITNRRVSM